MTLSLLSFTFQTCFFLLPFFCFASRRLRIVVFCFRSIIISTPFLACIFFHCHSVVTMRPVAHFTILTIIHDMKERERERVGDVKVHEDQRFDGYYKLLVGRCLLVLFNLNVCSCVQSSEALNSGKHVHVFALPDISACNRECQNYG